MGVLIVELGVPYTGWPVRAGGDYEFGLEDQRIGRDLRDRILDWARTFNRHFDEEHGWVSPAAAAAHRHIGRRLRDELQEALGDQYDVRITGMTM